MTEFKFADLKKKTVAQLRKIAEGTEHEALQDPAKMPKEELLAALCQALGIEAGEPPEETEPEQEPAVQEETAGESAPDSSKEDEEPVAQESKATEPPEESAKEEEKQEDKEAATAPEDEASEPAPEAAEEEKPAAKESAKKKKKEPAQEATPKEASPEVNKEKSKFKVQIRELKSKRDAALEAHDHIQLKAIRRQIRTLKRKVRRIAV